MNNRAFFKTIHSLAHPISVGAILLLLINDHILRHHWPSWWTGKMGDFAWLVFAPFVCATLLAWLVPKRFKQQEDIVGGLSIWLIGGWFVLAKTTPAIHDLTSQLWEIIIGWEGTLRIDLTDLVTLPALLISWYIWRGASNQCNKIAPRVWPMLGLALVTTLASTDPAWSDFGIRGLCETDGQLFTVIDEGYARYNDSEGNPQATSYNRLYYSDDGGLTWHERAYQYRSDTSQNHTANLPSCQNPSASTLADPQNPDVQYRYRQAEAIERTTDGRKTWNVVYDLSLLQPEIRRLHHETKGSWNPIVVYEPGPFGIVYHPATRNFIFSMGWDGILVLTPDDEWHWFPVGTGYRLENIRNFSNISRFAFFEICLAIALGFLILTSTEHRIRLQNKLKNWMLIIGWIGWFVLVFGALRFRITDFRAGDTTGPQLNYSQVALLALPLLLFVAIPLSSSALWDLSRNLTRVLLTKIIPVGLLAAILFLLPFALWTQGTIPQYRTAFIFSLILSVGSLAAASLYLKDLPRLKKDDSQTFEEQLNE